MAGGRGRRRRPSATGRFGTAVDDDNDTFEEG
jgi:hypothetical protein